MNKKGIDAFKTEIKIGDEIGVSTRYDSYFGKVKSILDDCFKIDENGLTQTIYYAHIWAYYMDGDCI